MSRIHIEIRLLCKCYKEKHSSEYEGKWICECSKITDHEDDCKKIEVHNILKKEWKEEETDYVEEISVDYSDWKKIEDHHRMDSMNNKKKSQQKVHENWKEKKQHRKCICKKKKRKSNEKNGYKYSLKKKYE
ncbi:hypothetical protein [Jeotgalibacillus proteolyticus]|uniref:hypothetical protein n=1 Tax=Jeotgalibacillus proteolyticus TaxID=2082395 RepID=UPI003CE8BC47